MMQTHILYNLVSTRARDLEIQNLKKEFFDHIIYLKTLISGRYWLETDPLDDFYNFGFKFVSRRFLICFIFSWVS